MKITFTPDSRTIIAVGYDIQAATLRMYFRRGDTVGAVWEYPDVSLSKVEAMLGAESVGKHWISSLRSILTPRGHELTGDDLDAALAQLDQARKVAA